ncbi:MAG: nucleotide sugar-1-phosphate transferase [Candidatus Hydrogenedentota bacterium]
MKAIIIGAGRGQRLMPHTENAPKCFAEVGGRRILDWAIESLHAGGLTDIVFIAGYQFDLVKSTYPHFTFCHNWDWANNNILESLMHAEEYMDEGFVCAYADILYRPEIIRDLVKSPHPITLVSDTDWRSRYIHRSDHPEDDGEKIALTNGSTRIAAINRTMPSDHAHGEYIGVARFLPEAARQLRDHYHRAKAHHGDGPFRAAKHFRKAYLIDLFQEMIDNGIEMHALATHGGYMEIDTNQDFHLARKEWSQ